MAISQYGYSLAPAGAGCCPFYGINAAKALRQEFGPFKKVQNATLTSHDYDANAA
jgi:phosphoenolpyruvate carboxylase